MAHRENTNQGFWQRAQTIDRRYLFVLLVVAVALPSFVRISIPVHVFDDTMGVYRSIEGVARANTGKRYRKMVLVMCDWGPGSKGENWPQTESVIHHMLRRGVPFMIMGIDTVGPTLAEGMAERIAPRYGRRYGVDWVSFGFRYFGDPQLLSFVKDVPGFVQRDIHGTPVAKLPVMAGIHDMSDVPLLIDVAAGPEVDRWIRLAQPTYRFKAAFGATAVMAPAYYPYLDSGQLSGLLVGMRGGAEYEELLGAPGQATQGMTLQSMAHLLVAALVILGNIGYVVGRRARR
jgi:hypothetical protein